MLRKSIGLVLTGLCLGLLFCNSSTIAQSPPRAKISKDQELQMFGKVLAAMQDVEGGFYDEAMSRYEKIIPDVEKYDYKPMLRWQAYNGYGRALFATGERDKAIIALKRAIEEAKKLSSKEIIESTENLALAYAQIGNLTESINQLNAALDLDKGNQDILVTLGSVYRRAKAFDKAQAIYEKMLASDSRNVIAYQNLGNVYLDQGELEKALAVFEKYTLYSKDKVTAARNIILVGYQYYRKKDYERSLALYDRALAITPDNPMAYTDIGWSMLGMGRTQKAIDAFEKALALNPPEDLKQYAQAGLKQARGTN